MLNVRLSTSETEHENVRKRRQCVAFELPPQTIQNEMIREQQLSYELNTKKKKMKRRANVKVI